MKKTLSFILCLLFALSACTSTQSTHDEGYEVVHQDVPQDSIQDTSQAKFDYHSVSLIPVDSTALSEIGYDNSHNVLLLRFLSSGALYAYYDVSKEEYDNLCASSSLGSYFNNHIKGNYAYEKLETGTRQTSSSANTKDNIINRYTTQQYVLNKSTKKFHLPECSSAGKIKEENKETRSSTGDDLINEGYSPCGSCLKNMK